MIGIDIEMPKCCHVCNFFIYSQENGILDVKNFDFNKSALSFRCCADLRIKRITSQEELIYRHKDCPLVEIKNEE